MLPALQIKLYAFDLLPFHWRSDCSPIHMPTGVWACACLSVTHTENKGHSYMACQADAQKDFLAKLYRCVYSASTGIQKCSCLLNLLFLVVRCVYQLLVHMVLTRLVSLYIHWNLENRNWNWMSALGFRSFMRCAILLFMPWWAEPEAYSSQFVCVYVCVHQSEEHSKELDTRKL